MIAEGSKLPFSLLLSLRTHLGRNRALSVVTVLAIATSVALAVGLELASRSVQSELERTAETLAGAAQIEVGGGDPGIPEEVLEAVSGVPGVLAAAPLIQVTLRVAAGPRAGLPLHIVGLDLLADQEVREFTILKNGLRVRDPLRLLAGVDSLIVTEGLARRLGLAEGDSLALRAGPRELRLVVRGTLAPGGIADAFGGQVAVMDVYSLQTLLGREGWLDRIDVVPQPGIDAEALRGRIAERVGGVANVRRSAARAGFVGRALATIRLVSLVLAAVGVVVACMLCYGAISLAVDRRIPELTALRAAGLESWRVRRLLWLDSLMLSCVGTLLGLGLGFPLSRSFLAVFSGISAHIRNIEIVQRELTWVTLGIGVGVGILVGLCGSIEPTLRACSRPPLDAIGSSDPPARRATPRASALLALLAAALWLGAWLAPAEVPALLRIALTLGLGLLLLSLLAAPLLLATLRRTRGWLERALPPIGRLLGASFMARPNQTRLTLTAIAAVVASVTAIMVVVESVTVSIHDWHAGRHQGGVLVTAVDPVSTLDRELISPETLAIVRGTPGVRAVMDDFGSYILFRGEEVLLGASSMDVMAAYGRLPVTQGDPAELARALVQGEMAISDGFAHRFEVRVGDEVTLDTPRGPRTFRAAGMVRDYGGPGGSVHLDLATFDRLWPRGGSTNLYIWTESPTEEVLERVQARVAERQALFFLHGRELESYAAKVIGRFTHLLYVIVALTLLLGGIAVMNLLIGSVLERRRELALLCVAGATARHIFALVLSDGIVVALVGGVLGMMLGLACAGRMSDLLTEEFGWTLAYAVDPSPLILLLLALAAASVLAGVYPAQAARQTVPTDVFAPE